MRVALLPSAYAPAVGGVEELTHRLATRLRAVGDDVEVWTNRHPPTLPEREIVDEIAVRRFALPVPAARAGQLARFPLDGAIALQRLRRAVASFRPDLLHVQCFSSNGAYATALAALARLPLVVTLQGETVMDDHDVYDRSAFFRAALRRGLRRADAVTACSRFVLDDAEKRFGLPPHAGAVVPNGVDAGDERTSPMDVPFDRFVFGVGRVVEKKGFDLLLDAFARIARERSGVGLVIGGDGPARERLAARARELDVEQRVTLPGTLSRAHVAWAMRRAAAFVLPSRVEPFGIVVLEALLAGCPAVVSSRGGACEIVRHEREGLVVDPFDTAALASSICRLLDDEDLRSRFAEAGRLRAQHFAWSEVAERYRAIYRDVTSRGSD